MFEPKSNLKINQFPVLTEVPEPKVLSNVDSYNHGKKKRFSKHQSKHLVSHSKNTVKPHQSTKKVKAEFSQNSMENSIADDEKAKSICQKCIQNPQDIHLNSQEKCCQQNLNFSECYSIQDKQKNYHHIRCRTKRSCSYPGETNYCAFEPSSSLVSSNSYKCLAEICDNSEQSKFQIRHTDSLSDLSEQDESRSELRNQAPCPEPLVDISPSIESISSRKSSTSTVRERNNSVDSVISQSSLSIIDISELESIYVQHSDSDSSVWKPKHSRSKSDASCSSNRVDVEECSDMSFSSSFPSSYSENTFSKKKSIFEGSQMVAPTECFFPQPQQGQSLTSFLSSNEFNIRAELDKENAHFCIAEAMISAIERIKCAKTSKLTQFEATEEESDEEIRDLTQRIRIRRRERQREKIMKNFVFWNDGRPDTTTSQSASPPLSSHSSDYEVDSIGSEDEIEDMELSDRTESNLTSMKENGLSLSMASLYSDADLQKMSGSCKDNSNRKCQDPDTNSLTAESVALALLKRFSEKQLPKASDLEWLVSEQEAPQRLLPLPDSWPISPDTVEEEFSTEKIRLRGNLDWAPPRPQIIFMIHPQLKRKVVIEKQKYQCAGCGMKIEQSLLSRFRYCNYYGKYFCQCCHSNDLAYIPGRILLKWDFTKYYVSKLAWNLLDQMHLDPLFSIIDINANLYKKFNYLEQCRVYRTQLFYLKDFMRTCRRASDLQSKIEQCSSYIFWEPHMYSLSDLLQVKSGELSKILYQLVNQCVSHVKHCALCQAKGFICEICDKESDIIYSFQLDKVTLCQKCGSCFHKRCFKAGVCPRCVRIQKRKSLQEEREYFNDEIEIHV